MYVYSVGIIDWWYGWQLPEKFFMPGTDFEDVPDEALTWGNWHRLWGHACALARDLGWEGDIREGPYVTVLPHFPYGPHGDDINNFSPVAIGWKQDNNGESFIASEVSIPWLEEFRQIDSNANQRKRP